MSTIEEEAPQPIEDGHILHFAIDRDEVVIFRVDCPNRGKTGLCNRRRDYCVVERFLAVYGVEINVGSAPINGPMEIAWFPQLGMSDLDMEFANIWIIPVADVEYQNAFHTPEV